MLRSAIEFAGYKIEGDAVTPGNTGDATSGAGRGASDTQMLMVKIFRETLKASGGRKSVPRADLVKAMKIAGIRESTAHIYLSNQGLFVCRKGQCRLADEVDVQPEAPLPKAGSTKRVASKLPATFGGTAMTYPESAETA